MMRRFVTLFSLVILIVNTLDKHVPQTFEPAKEKQAIEFMNAWFGEILSDETRFSTLSTSYYEWLQYKD